MNELIVHKVNIAHYRLVELSKLADQAKPFYDWIEKRAKQVTGSHRPFHEIMMSCSKPKIRAIIKACYLDANEEKPFLFDGIGRVYPHAKACFYFFAWMIRDAPQQRLSPLISRMHEADNVTRFNAEVDSLISLIYEYRPIVKSFEWQPLREVVVDRLEGSRRSISGHHLEANVRASLITSIQNYYSIHNSYGIFKKVTIAGGQIKVGTHTIDVSAELSPKKGNKTIRLLMPVKTRETEGGGHSHLFTRDITSAITDIKAEINNYRIAVVIVAENWSVNEIKKIDNAIDIVFHFSISPNAFHGFDEESQIRLNQYIERIFDGKYK